MSNQAYHNKGFGVAFTWIMILTMIVHGLLSVGKIVNMNEYVVEITIVNLDVTSA